MDKIKNMDKIESLFFQVEGSNFGISLSKIANLSAFLDAAEKTLESRLRELGKKMEGLGELKRTAGSR